MQDNTRIIDTVITICSDCVDLQFTDKDNLSMSDLFCSAQQLYEVYTGK